MSLFRVLAAIAGFATVTAFADPPIVQPGAPGETPRTLSADEATEIADTSYTPDDVRFMQGMIPHHEQALEMARLVAERTNNADVVDIAGRIESSQGDEIEFMNNWLEERGEKTVMVGMMDHSGMDHSKHAMIDHSTMAGMASPEDMAKLATLSGVEFDNLFLTGDWLKNGSDVGWVDGAIMSARQCTRAITGEHIHVYGETDFG